jgi:hypothetical protein
MNMVGGTKRQGFDADQLLPRVCVERTIPREGGLYLAHGLTRTGGKLHAREIGEYWNFNEAVGVAKQRIDDFLYREYQRAV